MTAASMHGWCAPCQGGDHDHCADNIFTSVECECDYCDTKPLNRPTAASSQEREVVDNAYAVLARIDDDTYEAEGFNQTTRTIDKVIEPYARLLIELWEEADRG